MGDYTHTGIKLVGRHLPEMHEEVAGPHRREDVELPGTYEIGALIEGAFIPLARLKAAEVLERIEAAKSERKTDEPTRGDGAASPPPPSEPPADPSPPPPEG